MYHFLLGGEGFQCVWHDPSDANEALAQAADVENPVVWNNLGAARMAKSSGKRVGESRLV